MTGSIQQIYDEFRKEMETEESKRIIEYLEGFYDEESCEPPGHKIGNFVILYTPINPPHDLVIIGNFPSWFDKNRRSLALDNLEEVSGKIPSVNSYLEHEHKLAGSLKKTFAKLSRNDLLESCLGLNRFWLQLGSSFDKVKPKRSYQPTLVPAWKNLEEHCIHGTRKIIELARPKAVALLGEAAQNAVPCEYRREHPEIVFKNCRYPASGGQNQFADDISDLIAKSNI